MRQVTRSLKGDTTTQRAHLRDSGKGVVTHDLGLSHKKMHRRHPRKHRKPWRNSRI